MNQIIYENFENIQEAANWANALIGDYLPGSDVWLVADIVQFEWRWDDLANTDDGTLILLVELEPSIEAE